MMNKALEHILKSLCEIEIMFEEVDENGKLFTSQERELQLAKLNLLDAKEHMKKSNVLKEKWK